MKTLAQILEFFAGQAEVANLAQPDLVVAGLASHSQQVSAGFAFVATAGASGHRNQFWADAKAQGAMCLLTDQQLETAQLETNLPVIYLPNLTEKLADFANWFFDYPSKNLKVIGITGTNGKTSTSNFVAQMLTNLKHKTGLLGTLGNGELGKLIPSQNTTLEPIHLQAWLAKFVAEGFEYAVLEVSSHAISLGRIAGIEFDCLALTQVTSDHIDFHLTQENYAETKQSLFFDFPAQTQVLNLDDKLGEATFAKLQKLGKTPFSYGKNATANLQLADLNQANAKLELALSYQNQAFQLQPDLVVGDFNAENILCALSCLLALNFELADLLPAAKALQPVAGRLQKVSTQKQISVFVDFAHTADALAKTLQALRPSLPAGKKLWLVFGCGGDRDQAKRPLMGKVAEDLADFVVLTNDNPRTENPAEIIQDILSGISETAKNSEQIQVVQDRKQAIELAINSTSSGDILLIAGKGHEDYQEINGEKLPFSDQQVAEDFYLWQASDLANATGGELFGETVAVSQLTTDSRTTRSGCGYIAIVGENFDGHEFAENAKAQGASLLIVSKKLPIDLPQILVKDTRLALGQIAKFHQQTLRNQGSLQKIIAVTGSNGKTTVKTLLAHVLSQQSNLQGKVLATQGNLNNDFGLPRTLLELRPKHSVAVVEMGANHPGEIDYLTKIAEPDLALITLAAGAHLEGFGSLEGVIQAKGEIFNGLNPAGIGLLNSDSAGFATWQKQLNNLALKSWSFGKLASAELQILNCEQTASGMEFALKYHNKTLAGFVPLLGEHNVYNATAVTAICLALGLEWQQISPALASFQGVAGRLQRHQLKDENLLIDDSYNANPNSVKAAIDVLATRSGYKVLVLGQMGELGVDASQQHKMIGAYAKSKKIDQLFGYGHFSKEALAGFADENATPKQPQTHEEIVAELNQILTNQQQVTILVKGSRSATMEQVVDPILTRFADALSS